MQKEKENLGFDVDPLWKVSEVRELLRRHEVVSPTPTYQTLINYIDDGTLRGFKSAHGHYLIYKSSVIEWIKSLQNRNGE